MPAPISIVIPTLNSERKLPDCLSALFEGLGDGLVRELIISDGGSEDETRRLATAVGAIFVEGPKGRGGQFRRGAEAASGEWLLFLHSDTVLPQGWSQVIRAALTDPRRASYFRIAFTERGFAPRWVAGWANMRARLFQLPYGDQGLLIARDLYDQLGGMPDQPLMEDVEMARRLKGRLQALPIVAHTSAERYKSEGWLRRGGRNLVLLTRYFLGASPEDLARAYRPTTDPD